MELVNAEKDKLTKTKVRYVIQDNEHGVSGTLYLDQEKGKKPQKILKMKLRLED